MINILKDYRDRTIDLVIRVGVEVFTVGDAFEFGFQKHMLTIPVNYNGNIEDKFIRFANKSKDKIKVVVIVHESDDKPSNLGKLKAQEVIFVNLSSELDPQAKKIRKALISAYGENYNDY